MGTGQFLEDEEGICINLAVTLPKEYSNISFIQFSQRNRRKMYIKVINNINVILIFVYTLYDHHLGRGGGRRGMGEGKIL